MFYRYTYIYISKPIVYVVDGSWLIYSSTGSWILWLSRQVVTKQLDRWVKNGCGWPERRPKMKELPENYCHVNAFWWENIGKYGKMMCETLESRFTRYFNQKHIRNCSSWRKVILKSLKFFRGDPCSFCCWRSIVEFSDQWLSTRNKYQNVWIRQQEW